MARVVSCARYPGQQPGADCEAVKNVKKKLCLNICYTAGGKCSASGLACSPAAALAEGAQSNAKFSLGTFPGARRSETARDFVWLRLELELAQGRQGFRVEFLTFCLEDLHFPSIHVWPQP